jgi:hypothetical protein
MFSREIIAELAEIDENLIRSPLTPSQEASAIFRRKAIYHKLHPTSPLATTSPPSQEPLSVSHSQLFRGAHSGGIPNRPINHAKMATSRLLHQGFPMGCGTVK